VASVAGWRAGDPYGALVALEPGTGAVRAMVGGRSWWGDPRFGRVNLATGAGGGGRPAGSAFKTFALVAALEQGIPPEAVFAAPDRLVVGRHGRGPAWPVANYEGHGFGHATLRSATALSINTVYAGLLVRLGGGDADRGAAAMVRAAARLGVASRLRVVPSAVLGTNEVTPLEMAGAYATLAAGGRRAAPFGCAGSPAPTAGCCTRPGPRATRSWPPGWRRSPPTCSGRWSTTAPGCGHHRPAGGRQDRHHPGPCRRLVRGLHPDPGHGRVGRLPPGPGADGAAPDRRPGLGRDLAGRFPRPDTRLVQVALDVERGCLPPRPRWPRWSTSRRRRRPGPGRRPARPGLALRPAPGAQAPVGGRVRLWVNPPSCPLRPRPPPAPARPPPPPPAGRAARVRSGGPGRGGPGRCGGWPRPGPARGGRRRR
jgi:Penicillin binding protein transpeptidase domain